MKGKMKPGIWGIVAIVAGIGISIWGSVVLLNATASSSWPKAQGEVIESKVNKVYKPSDRKNKRKPKITAEINYRYIVEGTTYSNNTVSYGQYSSTRTGRDRQREIVNRYPKGTPVDVHYNPKRPGTAVLEPGVTWSSFLWLGFGIIIIIGALLDSVKRSMKG